MSDSHAYDFILKLTSSSILDFWLNPKLLNVAYSALPCKMRDGEPSKLFSWGNLQDSPASNNKLFNVVCCQFKQ